MLVFCPCDLDLDQMTLTYELDPQVYVLFIADGSVFWGQACQPIVMACLRCDSVLHFCTVGRGFLRA